MALFDDQPSELSDELLSFLEPSDSYPLDDIFFTKTDHLQPSFHHHPSFSDPSYTPREPVDLYHRHGKRPKSCNDLHKPVELMFEANSYNAAITEPSPSSWNINAPEFFTGKKLSREWSSAQSMAARDRRKRISEKTQELARLIPGGNKMNTSEMLQAAFTYVKFLQAQVSVLALMQSFEVKEFEGVNGDRRTTSSVAIFQFHATKACK
ncbi:hypothetical protein J5N97_016465 [Dioscorea zingiberensis]|uniref:BHLH domain-containing protein n=1 Tax=Dioscorea zingiberensis TaxID=325984 RepID=A0A9D5CLU4_9LILI|nr:hypothetical protein J5N97_016465 [Dioscorea zingiberensis]